MSAILPELFQSLLERRRRVDQSLFAVITEAYPALAGRQPPVSRG
jgi:hypothetical protein